MSKLQAKKAEGFKLIYTDKSTGAKLDGSVWKPIPPEGFFIVGFAARNDYMPPNKVICFSQPEGANLLASPVDFERVWDNTTAWFFRNDGENHSSQQELAIYRPVAPAGYVSLGYIAIASHDEGHAMPTDVCCVRQDLVVDGVMGALRWQTLGCSVSQEFTMWDAVSNDRFAMSTGAFQLSFELDKTPNRPLPQTCILESWVGSSSSGSSGKSHLVDSQSFGSATKSQDPASRLPGEWVNVRVFLSSTFVDMHGERNVLIKKVFPELNTALRSRYIRLIPVDLRWGVLSDQVVEHSIQTTCLNEIDACRLGASQMPWFIALRGDRYGWVQDGYVPNHKFLRPELFGWLNDFRDRNKKISITSMEVYHAVLGTTPACPMNNTHAFSFFRDNAFMEGVPDNMKWVFDFDFVSENDTLPDEVQHQYVRVNNIDELRADFKEINELLRQSALSVAIDYHPTQADVRVTGRLPSGKLFGVGELKELSDFASQTTHALYNALCLEYPPITAKLDTSQLESLAHWQHVRQQCSLFFGREDLLSTMMRWCNPDGAALESGPSLPRVVWGAPGCGKSTVLCKFVMQLQESFAASSTSAEQGTLIFHMVGATQSSYQLVSLLSRVCEQLISKFQLEEELGTDFQELRDQLPVLIDQASRRTPILVILIDAVNQLHASDGAHSMAWLPLHVPANVRIIVTTLPHACLDNLRKTLGEERLLEVPTMQVDDRKNLVREFLAKYNKRLNENDADELLGNQMDQLLQLEQATSPLFLIASCEVLVRFGVYEELTKYIAQMAGTVVGLFEQVLVSMEDDHGAELVGTILGLVAQSRGGLMESEAMDMLDLYEWQSERISSFSKVNGTCLTMFVGSSASGMMRFFHEQLLFAVQRRYGLEKYSEHSIKLHTCAARYWQSVLEGNLANHDRAVLELPYHLLNARMYTELESTLTDLKFVATKAGVALSQLTRDYIDAIQELSTQSNNLNDAADRLREWLAFIRHNQRTLASFPDQMLQLALRLPDSSLPAQAAERYLAHMDQQQQDQQQQSDSQFLFRWTNKLQDPDPTVLTISAHSHYVVDAAFSEDGSRIVSGSKDNTAKVWDVQTGDEVSYLKGHSDGVARAVFTSDGGYVVTASADHTVRIWDSSLGTELVCLQGHSAGVNWVAVASDSSLLVSAGSDSKLVVWDLSGLGSGAEVKASERVTLHGHSKEVFGCDVNPNNSARAVSGGSDGTLKLWDTHTGQQLSTFKNNSVICSCSWNPHSSLVVFGDHGKKVGVMSTEGDELTNTHNIQSGFGWVYRVQWLPDGDRVIVGHRSANPIIVSVQTESKRQLIGHEQNTSAVSVSRDGRWAVTGSEDTTLRVWDLERSRPKRPGHYDPVLAMAHLPNINLLASSAESGWFLLFQCSGAEKVCEERTFEGNSWVTASADPNSDTGLVFVSTKHESTVAVFEVSSDGTANEVFRVDDAPDKVAAMTAAWNAEQETHVLVTGLADGRIAVWTYSAGAGDDDNGDDDGGEEGSLELQLTSDSAQGGTITCCALSSSLCRVATGSVDDSVAVWDVASGEQLALLVGHRNVVHDVKWEPDREDSLISASADRSVRLWRETAAAGDDGGASWSVVAVFRGHSKPVNSLAFAPLNARIFFSASNDKSIRIWQLPSDDAIQSSDALNVEEIGKYLVEADVCSMVAWSDDDHVVKLGTGDRQGFTDVLSVRLVGARSWTQ